MSDVSTFSLRLKSARIMKGYSMDELCERMEPKVSKMSISKYESGKMDPDSETLIALADALDQTPDYFFRPFTFRLESIRFRKKQHLGVKQIESVKMRIADFVERYVNIEEVCNSANNDVNFASFRVASVAQVKVAAAKLRERWNLGKDGIVNVIEMLEEHGVKVMEIDAPEGFDGVSTKVNDHIPVIVLSKKFSYERKRFTALHELGHLILNFGDRFSDKEQESLCNLFANEMLLPETELRRLLGDSRKRVAISELRPIQMRFGISCDAIMYKAKECGIIPVSFHKWFCIKKNQSPKYKSYVERTDAPAETSHRFESLVYKALENELITMSKAASLLCTDIVAIRKELLTTW